MMRRLLFAALALATAPAVAAAQGAPRIPVRHYLELSDTLGNPVSDDSAAVLRAFLKPKADSAGFRWELNGPTVIILYGPKPALPDTLAAWKQRGWIGRWSEDRAVESPRDTTAPAPEGALQSYSWGIDAEHAADAWALGARGQGILIVDLDTGADITHPAFAGRIVGFWNAVSGEDSTNIADVNGGCLGHGTHTLSTAGGSEASGVGMAPDALLFPIKVFGSSGSCLSYTSSQIYGLLKGMAKAAELGTRAVVNVSIGGSYSGSYDLRIQALRQVRGLLFGANGNYSTTPAVYPGSSDYAIGVGSVGPGMTHSGWENYGPTTDEAAPGESIIGASPGGSYVAKSGTSMATPHGVGSGAILMSVLDAPADTIQRRLCDSSDDLETPGHDDYTGCGLVRPDRAVKQLIADGGAVVQLAPRTITTRTSFCDPVGGTFAFTAIAWVPWAHIDAIHASPREVCWTADPALAPIGTTTTIPYTVRSIS